LEKDILPVNLARMLPKVVVVIDTKISRKIIAKKCIDEIINKAIFRFYSSSQ